MKMNESKNFFHSIVDLEKIIAQNRPIPNGAPIAYAIIFGPLAVLLALVIILPIILGKAHLELLILIAIANVCLYVLSTRMIVGWIPAIWPFNFLSEYQSRNVLGRTASFYYEGDGRLAFRIVDNPYLAVPDRITLNIPLGGAKRSIIVAHDHLDLSQVLNIRQEVFPTQEIWSVAITELGGVAVNPVPRLDTVSLSAEAAIAVDNVLVLLYDIYGINPVSSEKTIWH